MTEISPQLYFHFLKYFWVKIILNTYFHFSILSCVWNNLFFISIYQYYLFSLLVLSSLRNEYTCDQYFLFVIAIVMEYWEKNRMFIFMNQIIFYLHFFNILCLS